MGFSSPKATRTTKTVILYCLCCLCCLSCILSSCSKEESEAGEFDNWQARNESFFATLADSLQRNPSEWIRIKNYSLDPDSEGQSDEYIYVKVLEQGDKTTGSPSFTDSVRVIYQGRLIPSATYPQGYIFDGTVGSTFSIATSATSKQRVSSMIDGYATALQHMHCGDHWKVYIPSALAYGSTGNGSAIPGYSTVIFEVQLIDFSHAGETMKPWS